MKDILKGKEDLLDLWEAVESYKEEIYRNNFKKVMEDLFVGPTDVSIDLPFKNSYPNI